MQSLTLPKQPAQGFTLLELLLAFVVFALSFATVLEIMSGSMRNTVRARHYSEAALTAQSLMDQVGLDIPLQAGMTERGEVGDYQWELAITPFDGISGDSLLAEDLAELGGIELLEVSLQLSWGKPPREQSRWFHTVRAINPDSERRP